MGKLALVVLAVALGAWLFSAVGKGLGPGAGVVHTELLGAGGNPSDLDGFVRKGDSYALQIRFRDGADFVASLPYQGFIEVDCSAVAERFEFSVARLAAWPLWVPTWLDDVACYQRIAPSRWSPQSRDSLVVERGGGWLYFDSEGRSYAKPVGEGGP